MNIYQYNVVLDSAGRNALVMDSVAEYPYLDRLDSPGRTARLMRESFGLHTRAEEYLYLICANAKCIPIGFFELSHGTYNMTLASPREALVRALLCGAACMQLVHNHPSGDTTPSSADNQMTQEMKNAAELVGIGFCDHIIIGGDNYYSYREAGALGQARECDQAQT